MPNYIINNNKDSNGYNEVHTTACEHLPLKQNQVPLGWHVNSREAIAHAKRIGWKDADGCYYCCNDTHRD